jgi:hypothetical protein
MSESSEAMIGRLLWPHSAAQRAWSLETVALGTGYLAVYLLFDWVSTVEHNILANYSWGPNSGASFAAAVIFGPRILPFMFIAPLLGGILIPQHPLPLLFEVASAVLIGGVYSAAALFLLHPSRHFDRTLQSMSSLIVLTFTTVVSTAAVAAGYIAIDIAARRLGGFRPCVGKLLGRRHDRHHGDDAGRAGAMEQALGRVDVG